MATETRDWKKYVKPCGICGQDFEGKSYAKYCSPVCAKRGQLARIEEAARRKPKKKPAQPKPCRICQVVFQPVYSWSVYCSEPCRATGLLNYLEQGSLRRSEERRVRRSLESVKDVVEIVPHQEHPRGVYVYGWYAPGDSFPFYIGQGSGNRAWAIHLKSDYGKNKKAKAFCEAIRNKDTEVVIYRSNLTVEGGLLVESVLVSLFTRMGVVLTNQCETLKRQEKPPLEQMA